jgi:hypothetical protein
MADLGELDTLGVWLLEKMSRGAVEAGYHLADVVGSTRSWLVSSR